jgi:membrane-associated phospholipid phosphatase
MMFSKRLKAEGLGSCIKLWWRMIAWFLFLAPFSILTYQGSLELVSMRRDVPSILFEWESHIPFLAWTIVPYWSLNFFYPLSLFLSRSREELNLVALRLLTAQAIAVPIFLVAPLKLTNTRSEHAGIFEPLFDALALIDKPFNMAPSLHIALLVILWAFYAARVPVNWRWPVHLWSLLVAVSVLTAKQHHFIDVPAGFGLGVLCLLIWRPVTLPFRQRLLAKNFIAHDQKVDV